MHIFLAGAPYVPQHVQNSAGTYVWAHNNAAIIGIILGLALLHLWFGQHPEELDDARKDKTPGDTNSPDEGL